MARVLCDVEKNSLTETCDFKSTKSALYLGMGRLRSSPSTTPSYCLWATTRHSTESNEVIITGTKGQLQLQSERFVEFTCLYDCEIINLAILGCENMINYNLCVHEYGNLLYHGQHVKVAGFEQSLKRTNPFIPSVKSVTVTRTNCSSYYSDVEEIWKNIKVFVVDQVVDIGYSGGPVYHQVSGDIIGMLCGRIQNKSTNASMCLKAYYIADALVDNFVVTRKRNFSTS